MSIRLMGVMLGLGLCISSVIAVGPAAATGSDAALAKTLDLTRAELPHPTTWTSTAQTPNTAAETALGVKAVGCVKASSSVGAKVSTDPFGTTGIVGGSVTADEQSLSFVAKDSSAEPSASSEVVLLQSASQAADDLLSFASTPARGCFTTLLAAALKNAGIGKLKIASSSQALPHLGTGSGGFGLRFEVSGSQLSGSRLIDYTYFYVQGRAEIDLEFTNLNSQFPITWANAIAARVIDRARSSLG